MGDVPRVITYSGSDVAEGSLNLNPQLQSLMKESDFKGAQPYSFGKDFVEKAKCKLEAAAALRKSVYPSPKGKSGFRGSHPRLCKSRKTNDQQASVCEEQREAPQSKTFTSSGRQVKKPSRYCLVIVPESSQEKREEVVRNGEITEKSEWENTRELP